MTEQKYFVFSFGDFKVREREFLLVKAACTVPVEPKAFRVLLFLLRNPGRLVSKDEILDAVWSDCAVSDNSLTRSIATLRRLLGDDSREPHYIATVQTIGYRLLCEVRAVEEGSDRLEAAGSDGPAAIGTGIATHRKETPDQAAGDGKNRQLLRLAAFSAALLAVVGAGFLLQRAVRKTPAMAQSANAPAASSRMRLLPITTFPGTVRDPAFSPDGEKIAFIWTGDNPVMGDLYVQLVGGESPLRLTHTASGSMCCADLSPDGREIAFGRCDDRGGGVFIVPALGGPERKLTDVMCPFGDAGYPRWIAGGKSLLLADRCVPDGPRGIVVFSLETGEKRCLTSPPLHSEYGDSGPILSPDGTTVAFQRTTTVNVTEIYTVALSGGKAKQLTHDVEALCNPMWSSDGQYIIFDSNLQGLRRIPAAGGADEREIVYPATGALSRDGRRLAYVEDLVFSIELWRIALSRAGGQIVSQAKIVTSDFGNNAPQQSPDGQQIVFVSGRSGGIQIWRSEADGSNPLQLTFFDKGSSGTPRWSPDGKWIAFDYQHSHSQIYMIDSEGRNLHAVTSDNYENAVPGWSRDGAAVYFASNRSGSMQVWRRELDSGRETRLTHHGGFAAFESYDAKTIYYSRFEGGIWSMPVGGGEEHEVINALHKGYWGHFAVTDAGIYFVNSDAMPKPTIMFYNFQTRESTPVLQLEQDPVPLTANLAASRDGRAVWFAQETEHSSIRMVENFK